MKKIYLSILNEGWIRSELTIKLPKWLDEVRQNYSVYYESSFLRPIAHNRNTIVKRFLESDKDYLIQIDSDTVPPKNPLNLIEVMEEKEIHVLSCPVWIYQHKPILNIYKQKKDYLVPINPSEYSGLIEIDATGTGILLCSRKALEPLERPFERIFDNTYGIEQLGQDISFSIKTKEAGFKIYSHMDYICKHYKTIDISVLGEYYKQIENTRKNNK